MDANLMFYSLWQWMDRSGADVKAPSNMVNRGFIMDRSQEYTYEAFISYRHCPFDRKIALFIHHRLENFRVPKRFSSSCPAGTLKKVFLDNKELPTSSDLSKSIFDALTQSRYLIVVCSEDTPVSEYVKQEIETFVKLGRKDRIIPILISGDREKSFPEPLRQLYGPEVRYLTDIRTTGVANTKKMLERKSYDIISILTGINAATLYEMGARKRNSRLVIASLTIAGILMVYGGIALYSALRMYDMSRQMKYRTSLLTDSVQGYLELSLPAFHADEGSARTGIDALKRNEASLFRLLDDQVVLSTVDAFTENSEYSTGEETEIVENLAENLLYQGDLYSTLGEYDNSLVSYEKALNLLLSSEEAYAKSTYLMDRYDEFLLRTYEKLGDTYMNLNDISQASDSYRSGADAGSRWSGRMTDEGKTYDIILNSSLGRIYYHLGELYYHQGEMDRSQQFMNQATLYLSQLMKNITDIGSTHIRWLYDLAEDCTALRELYAIFGDSASLKRVASDEIEIRQRIMEKDPSSRNRYELAQCYSLLAGFSAQENNPAEAEIRYAEEFEIRMSLNSEAGSQPRALLSRQQTAINTLRIGNHYQLEGRAAEAENAYQEGFALMKECIRQDTPLLQKSRLITETLWHNANALTLLFEGKKYDEVLDRCRDDRSWISSLFDEKSTEVSFIRELIDRNTGNICFYEGRALLLKNEYDEALMHIQNGITLVKPHYERNSANAALSLSCLYDLKARVQLYLNDFAQAQENAAEATLITPGNMSFQITLAHIYLFNGQSDKAKKIYFQYKDVVAGNDEKTMGQLILQDLACFREHGLYSKDMDEIEVILKKPGTGQ